MLFVWGSKKVMKTKNDIKNGNRNTSIDSDLPDSIVFRECETTMKELYAEDSDSLERKIIKNSRENPEIAVVIGTNSKDDVLTDVKKAINMKDENYENSMRQIREHLKDNPQIKHLIGHSLGGFYTAQICEELNGSVKQVGVDPARVLSNSNMGKNSRSIQSDSNFDTTLDPYSVPEMYHPIKNYFTGKGAGVKVGHNSWKLKYKRGFIKKGANKVGAITGYKDGKIRFSQKI